MSNKQNTKQIDVTRRTIRICAEIAKVGRYSIRISWIAPFLAISKPNWTEEEELKATELDCYHAENLEDARRIADRPEWVLRLAHCVERDGNVEFRYEQVSQEGR
jgi:hypothetical protein